MNQVLTALCLGSMVLTSARCSTAPAGPTPLPDSGVPLAIPAVAGLWQGDFVADSCVNRSHERYACASFATDPRHYLLRLEQSGFEVSGTFGVSSGAASPRMLSDVSGHLEPSGALLLRGSRPAIDRYSSGANVNALILTFDKGNGLIGTFDYTTFGYSANYDPGSSRDGSVDVTGHIVTVRHQMWDPQPAWTGTWKGFYHVGTCSGGMYASRCEDFQEGIHDFELTINEMASSVSGELALSPFRVPVAGSSTSSSIRLEGSAKQTGSSATVRTFDWNVERNGVDRLSGKIFVTETYAASTQPMTYEAELVSVERVP